MSYEKEVEYLRKEFKKSEDKFREAEREGYETDADIWQNDMVNIGHQIHIHERAAKATEYEVKAKAFDESLEAIRVNLKSVRSDYGGFTLNALKKQRVVTSENVLEAMEILMVGLLEYHESGESDA